MALSLGSAAWAQRGDRAGDEEQRPPWFPVPPAPALSPEEALKSFRVAPGFRIELVASEPLVEDPVAIAFDARGRIWAVEMRGWMNDVEGKGNDQPIGRIVTLEDTDGDGRMDRSTVFMDGLVMPRAIAPALDGVLVAAPPYLWFCRDTDGDGKADEKTVVTDDYLNYETPQYNVESDPNGLLWNLDNWLYSARYNEGKRFRHRDGKWESAPARVAGQWGLTQDNYGRLFFNTNQDQLRANPLPGHYLARNPSLRTSPAWNAQVAEDQKVWPIRVGAGANRAYRAGVLRPDGTLQFFEAACGPVVYRGDLFPAGFRGNAFVPDPVGQLVKRNIVTEQEGILRAHHAYTGHEFLASTDERFRPVNLYTGPEGALYVVDLYRGIIEYIHVLTSYNRKQIESRNLDQPLGLGRIYRVVPDESGALPLPDLSGLSAEDLVGQLEHDNGWIRDTAQRLLVEAGDAALAPALRRLARSAPEALTRLHALWTLEGLEALESEELLSALRDPADKVRAAGVRLAEPWLRKSLDSPVAREVLARFRDPAAEVVLQLALSLGELPRNQADRALMDLALEPGGHPAAPAHPYLGHAMVSGLAGRELEFLDALARQAQAEEVQPRSEGLIAALAGAVFSTGDLSRIDRLFAGVGDASPYPVWAQLAIVRGVDDLSRKRLRGEPESMRSWSEISDPAVREAALKLRGELRWPAASTAPAVALTAEQRQRFERGQQHFAICATCHLPTGEGMTGLAPSLVDSHWIEASPEALARIVLGGKDEYDDFPPMPAFSSFDDEAIASILTYIRGKWGNGASPVDAELVERVRRETREHIGPWTAAELQAVSK